MPFGTISEQYEQMSPNERKLKNHVDITRLVGLCTVCILGGGHQLTLSQCPTVQRLAYGNVVPCIIMAIQWKQRNVGDTAKLTSFLATLLATWRYAVMPPGGELR
ncbi:hypothetical protein TNCV_8691 [Trichonephila clavipes]|nr:hypothetical protein TNCV_8691 [Trichonephila clavipes]